MTIEFEEPVRALALDANPLGSNETLGERFDALFRDHAGVDLSTTTRVTLFAVDSMSTALILEGGQYAFDGRVVATIAGTPLHELFGSSRLAGAIVDRAAIFGARAAVEAAIQSRAEGSLADADYVQRCTLESASRASMLLADASGQLEALVHHPLRCTKLAVAVSATKSAFVQDCEGDAEAFSAAKEELDEWRTSVAEAWVPDEEADFWDDAISLWAHALRVELSATAELAAEGTVLSGTTNVGLGDRPALLAAATVGLMLSVSASWQTEARSATVDGVGIPFERALAHLAGTAPPWDAEAPALARIDPCVAFGVSGETAVVPPLTIDCNEGAHERCGPGPDGAASYSAAAWAKGLKLLSDEAPTSAFHYAVAWKQEPDARCRFTLRAFGDLDADGEFSTFEREGIVREGVVTLDQPLGVTNRLD